MFDFRLKVFYAVAKSLSFTKAANELFISQPAVSKHIQEIESSLKIKLFERNGSKIQLTTAGGIMLNYAERIIGIYKDLEFEINTITKKYSGRLKIGASTTIAQYVLPQILANFHEKFNELTISLNVNNTELIENALQNNEIDLGVIEGSSKKAHLKYIPFAKDEIVLVTNSHNPLAKKQSLSIEELKNIPLLMREQGSGTQEVIAYNLKPLNLKISDLNIEMQLGSTESIKNYLLHSNCWAFLSVHSITTELKNNQLTIVDIENLIMERTFYFIQQQGETDTLSDFFMKFAMHYSY